MSVRRRRRAVAAAAVCCLLAAACAKRPAVAPAGPDRFPEFLYPDVPADLRRAAGPVVPTYEAAWRFLQAGDLRAAERGLAAALQRRPDFYPADAAFGYLELARRNESRAIERFDRALGRAPGYVPALVGRGEALLRAGRDDEALAAFEAALLADAGLPEVRRRVEALRFRGLERALSEARAAEQAGRLEEARAAYDRAVAASPESGFLLRELARVEQRLGRAADALTHARRAAEIDPADSQAHRLVGELLEAEGRLEDALAAFERARSTEPAPDLDARIETLRGRLALARLPPEYRAIPEADRLTRGQLAALVGVRFERLLRDAPASQVVLVTDTRGHWAQPWIMAVARTGVIEAYENHTFQPGALVRRGDLARTVSRLLELARRRDPAIGRAWSVDQIRFADLGPGNLYYRFAALAVASGAMTALEGGSFHAGRVVSGAEAVETLARLDRILGAAGSSR
jgi:tetratricopeptide (TPR) repeat protein